MLFSGAKLAKYENRAAFELRSSNVSADFSADLDAASVSLTLHLVFAYN